MLDWRLYKHNSLDNKDNKNNDNEDNDNNSQDDDNDNNNNKDNNKKTTTTNIVTMTIEAERKKLMLAQRANINLMLTCYVGSFRDVLFGFPAFPPKYF